MNSQSVFDLMQSESAKIAPGGSLRKIALKSAGVLTFVVIVIAQFIQS
jgi:hypothetical protein